MQDLKVVLVQANQIWEDKNANYKHYENLLKDLPSDIDLIIFPEMFNTCFSMKPELFSEPFNNSEGINWLKTISLTYKTAVCTSLMIKEQGKHYNRMIFIKENGEIAKYDKRHLFSLAKEEEHFSAGSSKQIVEVKGTKINLQICYDLRFPESARNGVLDFNFDYDVLLYVANWPKKRSSHWKSLIIARAIENQAYVVAVNRVGKDANDFEYAGNSAVINALGEIEVTSEKEEVMVHTLKAKQLNNAREKIPFLKDKHI